MSTGHYREPSIRTFEAESDLSALQYTFVKAGTAANQVEACGANERAIGVLMNAPEAGEAAEVAMPGGGALLKCNEAAARGQMLTSTAAGAGELVDAAGEWVGALAEEVAAAQNDVIGVYVTGFQAVASE